MCLKRSIGHSKARSTIKLYKKHSQTIIREREISSVVIYKRKQKKTKFAFYRLPDQSINHFFFPCRHHVYWHNDCLFLHDNMALLILFVRAKLPFTYFLKHHVHLLTLKEKKNNILVSVFKIRSFFDKGFAFLSVRVRAWIKNTKNIVV